MSRSTGGPSVVDILTARTTELPQGSIPLIYRPTEAEKYLQREIVQIADYLRRQQRRDYPEVTE